MRLSGLFRRLIEPWTDRQQHDWGSEGSSGLKPQINSMEGVLKRNQTHMVELGVPFYRCLGGFIRSL